ncbi:hypothetical protein CC1G_04505 [Coprinopsis cinerea okayama7|uniref:Uncharacterized protein n=1 Tax=Coprinopsis cinerea (strain Okayama-7 / 130 / ATCC MYA-4618 / FGSC 9003) TaxID=240176 RepID=A8N5C7_COPC7|nr:hypothetical protein CC1G_04505 [Coprinopsis cinerea okayama7\|eukprot:XP_001830072.2 hypothetical protein CC1G_04505 [Coprinopsis cinerea okayama7\
MASLTVNPVSEGEMRRGYKSRATHLHLPLSPVGGFDAEFEDDFKDVDFDFPMSCSESAGCWPTDEHWESGSEPFTSDLKSVFEDWEDFDGGLEVTIDEDGAQVIHIPSDSRFYQPPTPPRPFHYQPYSETQKASTNQPLSRFPDTRFSDTPTREVRISSKRSRVANHQRQLSIPAPTKQGGLVDSQGTFLLLDTSFITNMTSTVNLSTLTTSWCSPQSTQQEKKTLPWIHGIEREADVPCSAIALSPTELLGEMNFTMIQA